MDNLESCQITWRGKDTQISVKSEKFAGLSLWRAFCIEAYLSSATRVFLRYPK